MNRRTGSLVAAILVIAAVPTAAQWLNYPTAGVPKTADGRPNLNAPTPRTPDGHPDLSGLWKPQNTMRQTRVLIVSDRSSISGPT